MIPVYGFMLALRWLRSCSA